MKKKSGSHDFRIQGKISMYICLMFYALVIVYFLFFRILMQAIYISG